MKKFVQYQKPIKICNSFAFIIRKKNYLLDSDKYYRISIEINEVN